MKLPEVLNLLASTAAEQISFLQALGGSQYVDELGLLFDDVAAPFLADSPSLRALDAALGAVPAKDWNEAALRTSRSWVEVRAAADLARRSLESPRGS